MPTEREREGRDNGCLLHHRTLLLHGHQTVFRWQGYPMYGRILQEQIRAVLWLNVTYNYGHFYYQPEVFGENGIRSIYGKTGAESIPMLEKAISALGDDVDDSDYWHATEGNAKRALYGLLAFAKMRPDGVWEGD